MRSGDFSALGTKIYDPLTTCGVAGTPACDRGNPRGHNSHGMS